MSVSSRRPVLSVAITDDFLRLFSTIASSPKASPRVRVTTVLATIFSRSITETRTAEKSTGDFSGTWANIAPRLIIQRRTAILSLRTLKRKLCELKQLQAKHTSSGTNIFHLKKANWALKRRVTNANTKRRVEKERELYLNSPTITERISIDKAHHKNCTVILLIS